MNFENFREELEQKIKDAYVNTPTADEAESLAAYFLDARLIVGRELRDVALDSRMRRTGLKAIKAGVLLENATKGDKKPSDSILVALVDTSHAVKQAQGEFDAAEVEGNDLQNLLEVTKEAHLFFRGISKGRMD